MLGTVEVLYQDSQHLARDRDCGDTSDDLVDDTYETDNAYELQARSER